MLVLNSYFGVYLNDTFEDTVTVWVFSTYLQQFHCKLPNV